MKTYSSEICCWMTSFLNLITCSGRKPMVSVTVLCYLAVKELFLLWKFRVQLIKESSVSSWLWVFSRCTESRWSWRCRREPGSSVARSLTVSLSPFRDMGFSLAGNWFDHSLSPTPFRYCWYACQATCSHTTHAVCNDIGGRFTTHFFFFLQYNWFQTKRNRKSWNSAIIL